MTIKLPEPTLFGVFAWGRFDREKTGEKAAHELVAMFPESACAKSEPLYTEAQLKQAIRDVLEEAAKEFEHMGGLKDGYSCASRLRTLKEHL